MTRKILCPFHEEKTPSFAIYKNGNGYCFGCGAMSVVDPTKIPKEYLNDPEPENIEETLRYIESLPKACFRGHDLHHDATSYYLVWPDRTYYKRRLKNPSRPGDKYRNPVGVPQSLFVPKGQREGVPLMVVEGEFNALAIAVSTDLVDVVSPGSANQLYQEKHRSRLDYYRQYKQVYIVADDDEAGILGAIDLKTNLDRLGVSSTISLWAKPNDAAHILETYGKQAVEAKVKETLGLLGRLPGGSGPMSTLGTEYQGSELQSKQRGVGPREVRPTYRLADPRRQPFLLRGAASFDGCWGAGV